MYIILMLSSNFTALNSDVSVTKITISPFFSFFLRPSCQRRERVASLETQERSKRQVYISHSSNPNITNLPVYSCSERFK